MYFFFRTAAKKRTALTNRQNENSALIELSSMLPIGHQSSSVDELSVLRFTIAYVKLKMFLHEGIHTQTTIYSTHNHTICTHTPTQHTHTYVQVYGRTYPSLFILSTANIFSDNLHKAHSSVGGDSKSLSIKNLAMPNGEDRKKLQTISSGIFDLSAMFNKVGVACHTHPV